MISHLMCRTTRVLSPSTRLEEAGGKEDLNEMTMTSQTFFSQNNYLFLHCYPFFCKLSAQKKKEISERDPAVILNREKGHTPRKETFSWR